MNTSTPAFLKVYYCYAKEDEEDEKLRDQLTAHLSPLRQERKLTIWFDVMVKGGMDWKMEVEKHFDEADLILLLISASFMASNYCYNLQLTALSRHEAGKVEIIPVLLRPVIWQETPIKRLPLILPTSKLPITLWSNRDEAFVNVASAIRDLIQARLLSNRQIPANEIAVLDQLGEAVLDTQCPQCGTSNRIGAKFCKNDGVNLVSSQMIVVPRPMPSSRTKEMWLKEGQRLSKQRQYADALAAYEQALLLDSQYATAYFYKGHVLYTLQQYAEALTAYEQAVRFNPVSAAAHCYKGDTLRHLKRYPAALAAYEQSLQLGPLEIQAHACNGKGRVFFDLKQYTEASAAYEQALQLNPNDVETYLNKGNLLSALKQYAEALAAYEQALQIDLHYAAAYFFKGNVLSDLKQYAEALAAYEQALQIDSHYAAAYYGKGRVYTLLGYEKEAQEAFGKADSLNATSS